MLIEDYKVILNIKLMFIYVYKNSNIEDYSYDIKYVLF